MLRRVRPVLKSNNVERALCGLDLTNPLLDTMFVLKTNEIGPIDGRRQRIRRPGLSVS
jgi:hypothetical protein